MPGMAFTVFLRGLESDLVLLAGVGGEADAAFKDADGDAMPVLRTAILKSK